jgi:hypothetical protein
MILIFSAKSNNFRGESIFSNYFDLYILHFFADQMLEFVYGFFLYASFVIYISISMVEIMWVRVNYKVMRV